MRRPPPSSPCINSLSLPLLLLPLPLPLADLPADHYVAVSEAVMAKVTGLESVGRDSLAAELALPGVAHIIGIR